MESWIVSAVIAIGGVVSTVAIMKNKIDEAKKNQEIIFKRLETHGDDLVALNTMAKLAMTAKDVDEKYVSKELFRQFEKHIDKRFDGLEAGQGKILSYIEKANGVK